MKKKHRYDYLWIWSVVYFTLGFFNILFAWLGLIDFFLPLLIALIGGNKWFCNHLCGRGQLFALLPKKVKCSRNKPAPGWLSSKWFRYGFFGVLYDDVRNHGVSDVCGVQRCFIPSGGGQTVLDIPCTVGICL